MGSLALAACAGNASVEPSGFLGDYAQLKPGRRDQAQLVYIDPAADFSPYAKVLVDPVVVWAPTASRDAPEAELRGLAAEFGAELREQLRHEFELVERPAPGTLRIRTALTHVHEPGTSIELEVLDAQSGRRLVAVADTRKRANAREAFAFWAERARVRLAAFRSFDAAEAAHDAGAER